MGYEKKRIEWESKIEKYVKKKCTGCSVICSDPHPETRSNQIETDLSCYHSSLFIDVVSEVCQLLVVLPPCFCKNKHKLRGWAQNTLTHSYVSILCLLDPRLLRLCQKTHYFSGAGAHCSSFEQIHMLISNTKKPQLWSLSYYHLSCILGVFFSMSAPFQRRRSRPLSPSNSGIPLRWIFIKFRWIWKAGRSAVNSSRHRSTHCFKRGYF